MNESVKNNSFSPNRRKLILLVAAMVVGIFLILGGFEMFESKNEPASNEQNEIHYTEMMEQKIEEFLSTVTGIDTVKVFVTIDGTNEYEYAQKSSNSGYTLDYLIIDGAGGNEAAIVREVYPKIRGVAVSCTGGNDATTQKQIISLLSAGLGIPTNKIRVAGYK